MLLFAYYRYLLAPQLKRLGTVLDKRRERSERLPSTTLAGSSGLLSTGSTDLLAVFGAGSKRRSSVDGATKRSSLSTAAADGVRM